MAALVLSLMRAATTPRLAGSIDVLPTEPAAHGLPAPVCAKLMLHSVEVEVAMLPIEDVETESGVSACANNGHVVRAGKRINTDQSLANSLIGRCNSSHLICALSG